MNRIFVKLLLAFQLVILLSVSSIVIVSVALRKEAVILRLMMLRGNNGVAQHIAESAAQAYDLGGRDALQRYIQTTEQELGLRLFLFDRAGQELTRQSMLPGVVEQAKGIQADNLLQNLWRASYLQRTVITEGKLSRLPYIAVTVDVEDNHLPLLGPALRILLILLGEVTISLVLTQLLTRPIVSLRNAVQHWAAGDLSVRANSQSRDEIGELARDFDQMAARLERMMAAQKQLLADISHELRSPLARLTVAAELARQRLGAGNDTTMDRITRETERMNNLIGELLTLSRLESGVETLATDTGPVDLRLLVQEVAQDADFEARARGASVEIALPPGGVLLQSGDHELLRRAVENVVRNAVRYTETGTVVHVTLATSPWDAVLTVRDQGPGVPPDALSELFRPFYRVGSDRDRASGGVGLGLAITERAIRLHGGTLTAENASHPTGLLITFHLPLTS